MALLHVVSVSHPKPDPTEPGEKHGSGLFVILWDTRRVCVSVSIYYYLFVISRAPKSWTSIWLFFFFLTLQLELLILALSPQPRAGLGLQ